MAQTQAVSGQPMDVDFKNDVAVLGMALESQSLVLAVYRSRGHLLYIATRLRALLTTLEILRSVREHVFTLVNGSQIVFCIESAVEEKHRGHSNVHVFRGY